MKREDNGFRLVGDIGGREAAGSIVSGGSGSADIDLIPRGTEWLRETPCVGARVRFDGGGG